MQLITLFRLLALVCALWSFIPLQANPKEPVETKQFSSPSLSFVENKGQVTDQYRKQRNDIDFKLSGQGINIFVGDGAIHYIWQKPCVLKHQSKISQERDSGSAKNKCAEELETYRLDVKLLGANKHAQLKLEGRTEYTEHYHLDYFRGTVQSYSKAVYKNIYPNIDWVLYIQNGHVKYDFVVHPGGNPNNIKLQYDGATSLSLHDGAFKATTPFGSLTEEQPYSYDQVTRRALPSSFRLHENVLSFNIEARADQGIVIDPQLQWATYYGGSYYDYASNVATNNLGDSYLSGRTGSANNIATVGAHQSSAVGNYEGFVAKFNANGARQWGTYVGGSGNEEFISIQCDPVGNVYASGSATSSGLATTGAHKTTVGGNCDAFLVKFNSSGVVQWSTYYGGSSTQEIGWVACDTSGNVYLGGTTSSTTDIATSGAFQTTPSGYHDVFLARFSASGVRQWGTYFGGAYVESLSSIDCDQAGNVYIAGTTTSSGLATSGTYYATVSSNDGFLAKFSSAGARLWMTYLGGGKVVDITDMACDSFGNTYVAGYSTQTGLATTGAYRTSPSSYDAILMKFDTSGSRVWSTYFGGTGDDMAGSVTVGYNGRVYLSGRTSSNSIATSGAYKTTRLANVPGNVNFDVYLAEFTSAGVRNWCSYFGGRLWEEGYTTFNAVGPFNQMGLASTGAGKVFMSGTTYSDSAVATTGAHQTAYGGNPDGFLTSWVVDTVVLVKQPFYDTSFCPGDTFQLHYYVTAPFKSSNVFTVQLSDANGSFASAVNIGTLSAATDSNIRVVIPMNTPAGTGYRIRIAATAPARTCVDNFKNITVKPLPNLSASSNSPVCTGDTVMLFCSATPSTGASYGWTGPGSFTSATQNPTRLPATTGMAGDYIVTAIRQGCSAKDTVTVAVNTTPATPAASYNSPLCMGDTLRLSATVMSGATYSWTGPNSFTSSVRTPERKLTQYSDSGYYVVRATVNGCISSPDSIKVKINTASLDVSVSPDDTICEGDPVTFTATALPALATKTYQWYKGTTSIGGATSGTYSGSLLPADSIIYCNVSLSNVCANTVMIKDTIKMLVKLLPVSVASSNSPVCTGDTIKLFSSSTPSAGVSYSWSGPATFNPTVQNPIRLTATTSMGGDYIVTATLQGCSFKDTVTVVVNTTPGKPTASYNAPLCLGDTLRLSATVVTGASYSWTGSNSFTSLIRTPEKVITQLSDSGFYSVKAIANGCSSQPDTVKVKLNSVSLDVSVSPNDTICASDPVNFSAVFLPASASPSYQWYNGAAFLPSATSNSYATNTLAAGDSIIYCRVIVNNVCAHTVTLRDTVKMHVKPLPNVSATSNAPVCSSDTLELFASSTSMGSVSYNWVGPGAYSSSDQNPVIYASTIAMTGNYIVTATLLACNATDTVTVLVNPTPVTPVASADTFVCVGDTLYLSASTVAGASYVWNGPGGFISHAQDTFRANMLVTDSGPYMVSTILGSCMSLPDTVWIAALPQLDLDVQILAVPGTGLRPTDSVTLEAFLPNGGALLQYQWYKNGVLQPADTSAIWKTAGLTHGDTVIVVVTTSYPCAPVTSASDTIVFDFPAAIDELPRKGNIRLYPNPNKGNFTVEGIKSEIADVEIINAIGQIVYKENIVSSSVGAISIGSKLAVGHYLIKVRQEHHTDMLRFVVLE